METDNAIRIQREYRIRQIKRMMRILNINKTNLKNKNFEEFSELIQHEHILKMTKFIISKITRVADFNNSPPLTSHQFLSSFMFYGFRSDILDNKEIERNFDDAMFNISNKVVNKYEELLNKINIDNIKDFYKTLGEYNTIFIGWKRRDLNVLINSLTISYYELETMIALINMKKDLDKDETDFITLGKMQQEDIMHKIIMVGGYEYCINFNHKPITNKIVEQHVRQTLNKAFWDILIDELNAKPPVYDQLLNVLTEIRDMFCEFVPNRLDIQEEIKEKIDPILIKNMIENNAFEKSELYNLSIYIISLVKKFQPAVMDEDVINWEKNMIKHFDEEFNYTYFLVIFFKSVYNMIHTIIFYITKLSKLE